MSSVGIIIQARTGSSRLPNKVILPFYKGESIIELMIKRLSVLKNVGLKIILSTSKKKQDDILVKIADDLDINYFRGDENDVLNRFYETSQIFNLTTIVRVCADNPFIDLNGILHLIEMRRKEPNMDYYSFKNQQGLPVIKTHIGLFAELFTFKALSKARELVKNDFYKEHVTNFIYEHTDRFKVYLEKSFNEVYKRNDLRFTIDDSMDFSNLSRVYDYYASNDHNIHETIRFIDSHDEITEIMKIGINKYNK
jgi:spore coat polysaccharide biosynthesis protein SpsF